MGIEQAEPSLFEIKQWTRHGASGELFWEILPKLDSAENSYCISFRFRWWQRMDEHWACLFSHKHMDSYGDVIIYRQTETQVLVYHIKYRWRTPCKHALVGRLTGFGWLSHLNVTFALIIKSHLSSKSNCYQLLFWSLARIHFVACQVNISTNVNWFWIWFDELSLLEENNGSFKSKIFVENKNTPHLLSRWRSCDWNYYAILGLFHSLNFVWMNSQNEGKKVWYFIWRRISCFEQIKERRQMKRLLKM